MYLKKLSKISLSILILFFCVSSLTADDNTVGSQWLAKVMDQFHTNYFVFIDASSAGNNFNARGYMGNLVSKMQHDWTNNPYAGVTCIRAYVNSSTSDGWAGYYFMNGTLSGTNTGPSVNWGTVSNAGVDLTGATNIKFWARGDEGGEVVEFFALGVGRDEWGNAVEDYPDSSAKVTTGNITLTTNWTEYNISLVGKDISYVIGGFGWASTKTANTDPTVFYLDDISYNLCRTNQPRFLVSYKVVQSTNDFDSVLVNFSYLYDNVMAMLAFIAAGEQERARLIAEAIVYAQENDRYYTDGRLRNAYQGGELTLPTGWIPNNVTNSVRSAGFWDSYYETWNEDRYAVSTDTGNIAWAMLALITYDQTYNTTNYTSAAAKLGDWVEDTLKCTNEQAGYYGQIEGWEPNVVTNTYKSIEHNIDLYVVFSRLYDLTSEGKWTNRANHALKFIKTLYTTNSNGSHFWTGTDSDGDIEYYPIVTDCHSWSLIALRDEASDYWAGLKWVEDYAQLPGTWGFDFDAVEAISPDGIWYEGTAQMATAYMYTGQWTKASNVLVELSNGRSSSGAMYAAGPNGTNSLSTGFWLSEGEWRYYRREHVGATAWAVIAEKKLNAFWIGTSFEDLSPQIGKVYIEDLGNGNAKFSIILTNQKTSVQLFSKQNNIQDYVNNYLATNEVNNGNGTYTYSCIRKNAYVSNDSIIARFYTYSVSDGQVFYPGPTSATFSDAITYYSTAEDLITIENLGSGDAKFSITVPESKLQVQLFARKNGFQDYVNNGLASTEVDNGDGTYTYSVTRTGIYSSGDVIDCRFYTYSTTFGVSQIFYPGPSSTTFSPSITY